MKKEIIDKDNKIKELNTQIEKIEKEKNNESNLETDIISKDDNINEFKIKLESIDKEMKSKTNTFNELNSKIEKITNDINEQNNKNNIINNKINELEINSINSKKNTVLIRIWSRYNKTYYKLEKERRKLKANFYKIEDTNVINQLLNTNKILYFRKFANLLYYKLMKKLNGTLKTTFPPEFFNIFDPRFKQFGQVYAYKDVNGIEATKITCIIDFIYFIKEECSYIIHLQKKFIKDDLYLDHLIYLENKIKNYESITNEEKENETESSDKNNENEIKEEEQIIHKKMIKLHQLCSYLFDEGKKEDTELLHDESNNKLNKAGIDPRSESTFISNNEISNIDKNNEEKEENKKEKKEKIKVKEFFDENDELKLSQVKDFIYKEDKEFANKIVSLEKGRYLCDLEVLQKKIKSIKEKIEKYKGLLSKKEKIEKINSEYFLKGYKEAFTIDYYKPYIGKFNIKSIKDVVEKHYRFQKSYLDKVNKDCFKSLKEIKEVVLKLMDGNEEIDVYEEDQGEFSKKINFSNTHKKTNNNKKNWNFKNY